MTDDDLKQVRRDVAGFTGRFFFDPEHGDIAFIAKACDACECDHPRNRDGDPDCGVSIADAHDEYTAEPAVRMLNAVPALLAEVERLRAMLR